jgi:hydroxymethylbilane synthase
MRLGLGERIRSRFEVDAMLPAAGQGALGIEVRADAGLLRELLEKTAHTPTALGAEAERAVSRALGGSCSMPLAAHARWQGDTLQLDAALGHATVFTQPLLRVRLQAPVRDAAAARALGEQAARQLAQAGAQGYLHTAA